MSIFFCNFVLLTQAIANGCISKTKITNLKIFLKCLVFRELLANFKLTNDIELKKAAIRYNAKRNLASRWCGSTVFAFKI